MTDIVKVKKAFNLFYSNLGKVLQLATLESLTGWKKSTINTYFNKNGKAKFLLE
jgi:hypothetical protein